HAGDHVPRTEPVRRRPGALERHLARRVDRSAGEGSRAEVVIHMIDEPGERVARRRVRHRGGSENGKQRHTPRKSDRHWLLLRKLAQETGSSVIGGPTLTTLGRL